MFLLHYLTLSILLSFSLVIICSAEPKRRGDNVKTIFRKDGEEGGEDGTSNRNGKLFSLFNVVQFKNDACGSTDTVPGGGGSRNGTCYTSKECTDKGGSPKGNCAAGFGVCCVFIASTAMSTDISQNSTYIQNPGYPSAYTAVAGITYTVRKSQPDVCFLRLDFVTLSLLGTGFMMDATVATEAAWPCMDTFQVTTQTGQKIPVLCGENSALHMYVDMGTQATDTATLAFTFGTGMPGTARAWDIKASQYTCSDKNAPPEGCLQYMTGLTGQITTFNFNGINGNHLPNHQYSVCIRQENGYCCVQYQVCPGVTNAFSLSGATMPATAMQDSVCVTDSGDYIGIAGSSSACVQGFGTPGLKSRYCGIFFSDIQKAGDHAPICDCTPPFSVEIYTNNLGDVAATATEVSRGVCLQWVQLPCTG